MKLKFPNSTYNIELTNEIEPFDEMPADELIVLGYTDMKTRTIAIVRGQRMYEYLLHEIVHALLFECGLMDLGYNEAAVWSITDKLLYLLRKNKRIFLNIMFEGDENGKKALSAFFKALSSSRGKTKKTQRDQADVDKNE